MSAIAWEIGWVSTGWGISGRGHCMNARTRLTTSLAPRGMRFTSSWRSSCDNQRWSDTGLICRWAGSWLSHKDGKNGTYVIDDNAASDFRL